MANEVSKLAIGPSKTAAIATCDWSAATPKRIGPGRQRHQGVHAGKNVLRREAIGTWRIKDWSNSWRNRN
jgi:hypothetical protein